MITKTAIRIVPPSAWKKAPKAFGKFMAGAADPFTVGLSSLALANGSESVGGAVGGAVAGSAAYKGANKLLGSLKFLNKGRLGPWAKTIGGLAAMQAGFGTGSSLGNRYTPIWKRKS